MSEVPYSLVFPDPSFSMVLGLSQIKKMSQSGSKFKKCELILNVNRLLVQKFGIPTPKAGKIQKMVKSLVNTDMHAWEPSGGVKRLKTKWVIDREVD